MIARPQLSLHLTDGNESTKAVTQRNGGGVNLWIGGICITADNALLFHELAKLAGLAAQLQESCDERKDLTHAFTISMEAERVFREIKMDPAGDLCTICSRRRDHDIHGTSSSASEASHG